MANNSTASQQDALLTEWGRRSRLARLLRPGDLLQESVASGEEILECHRRTLDFLTMEDRVNSRVVKSAEARKYSPDLNYRPQDFRNQSSQPHRQCPRSSVRQLFRLGPGVLPHKNAVPRLRRFRASSPGLRQLWGKRPRWLGQGTPLHGMHRRKTGSRLPKLKIRRSCLRTV